ncbi:MAG: iron-containing redox enzyme family protein [Candidatus Acidiferrales bacterium]
MMYRKRKEARPKSILESIDALIEEHHLLKHPFYRAWTEGTLSKASLQLYAEQHYQHVRAFPDNLTKLAERAPMPLAGLVRENLAEDTNSSAPHPMLWRQFAQSLGVGEGSMDAARPLPGVAALLDTFEEVSTQGTMAEAVAAFYAYQAQVPEISSENLAGLKRFYEVREPRAVAYFVVYQEADVRHRAAWRTWLVSRPAIDEVGAICSAHRTLKALWGALDAVFPRACASATN